MRVLFISVQVVEGMTEVGPYLIICSSLLVHEHMCYDLPVVAGACTDFPMVQFATSNVVMERNVVVDIAGCDESSVDILCHSPNLT